MKRLLSKILFVIFINGWLLKAEALVPYFYFPTLKNLERESLSIAKNAYQLLYFGQIEDSLNLAKLAVQIYKSDEKLWLILSETQIANKLYDEALLSLKNAQKINSNLSEIYFAESNIYLKRKQLINAEDALKKGLKIDPNNHKAIFQLGNIFLMKKDYSTAINSFDKAVNIKPKFWQAINNQALAYFELDKRNQSIRFFEKAISLEENAESLLGLASCLRIEDIDSAVSLAKKALAKDPNYVGSDYRKEQLWGEKLQESTKKLFTNENLKKDIKVAKSKIREVY